MPGAFDKDGNLSAGMAAEVVKAIPVAQAVKDAVESGMAEYAGKTVRFTCPKCQFVFLPNAKERQSRTGKSSRAKGANFERAMAKKLQKWWGNGSVWKRTPMSGGSVLKEGFDLAGDVCCNDKSMLMHFELKNSPTKFAGLHQVLSASNCAVYKWLEQAKTDCPVHREPMLIVNRFDEQTYCMTTTNMFPRISHVLIQAGMRYMVLRLDKLPVEPSDLVFTNMLVIWLLDYLLASDPKHWVTPQLVTP